MTHDPDRTLPPVPSSPPPVPPYPPYAPHQGPSTGHGTPPWAWWVVGILIPVIGLAVTVITQQQSGSSHAAPPVADSSTASSPAQDTPVTPSASTGGEPADDENDSAGDPASPSASDSTPDADSPSPSSTSAAVIRSGGFTLDSGSSADLEHGTTGKSVKSPDISWSGTDDFSALNGRVADAGGAGVTASRCADRIQEYSRGSGWMTQDGEWFCLPTSAGHVAALESLGYDDEGGGRRFHYIVWDMAAPGD